MTSENNLKILEKAINYVKNNSQEHLADYFEEKYLPGNLKLAHDILGTDIKKYNHIYRSYFAEENITEKKENELNSEQSEGRKNGLSTGNNTAADADCHEEDLPEDNIQPMDICISMNLNSSEKKRLYDKGIDYISSGKTAVITMAGGEGTRLGHIGPKGTYILPLKTPKTFFEIQIQRLLSLADKTQTVIPWFIMTSPNNHDGTVEYFKQNDYFGYGESNITFFPQNTIPIGDFEGKLLVRNNEILRGGDGNGGIFAALGDSGMIDRISSLGIEKVFVCGIDNVFVKILDPLFLGFALESGMDIASKSVMKRSYDEKAGVFCRKNGKPSYIEYMEISDENAKKTDINGEFVYGDIGIVAYYYDIKVLRNLVNAPLPYHVSMKKFNYHLPGGQEVVVEKPNCLKFEAFIFDSFNYVNDVAVMRVDRDEEFMPIKNAEGEDSPETVKGLDL